jgi:hypothetical protein
MPARRRRFTVERDEREDVLDAPTRYRLQFRFAESVICAAAQGWRSGLFGAPNNRSFLMANLENDFVPRRLVRQSNLMVLGNQCAQRHRRSQRVSMSRSQRGNDARAHDAPVNVTAELVVALVRTRLGYRSRAHRTNDLRVAIVALRGETPERQAATKQPTQSHEA